MLIIKSLGHASFQVKSEGQVIYIDLKKYGDIVETTEKADLILVTHSHADHFSAEKIKKLSTRETVVIAPSKSASKLGKTVKTLKPGEEASCDKIKVRAVEAYNTKRFRSPGKPWHPKGFGVGYMLSVEGTTIYHAGDTDFVPEMKSLGHVDVALLPTGDKYTMDNAEAAEAALVIKPRIVVPMHRWETDPKEFKKKVESKSDIRVIILKPGEEFEMP